MRRTTPEEIDLGLRNQFSQTAVASRHIELIDTVGGEAMDRAHPNDRFSATVSFGRAGLTAEALAKAGTSHLANLCFNSAYPVCDSTRLQFAPAA